MKRLALGTLALLGACGPGGRTGHAKPDAPDGIVDGTGPVASHVYAHSGNKLYQIDTTTLSPVEVGMMNGLGTQSLTDLAIDKDDNFTGITLDKLYTLDATTGAATLI